MAELTQNDVIAKVEELFDMGYGDGTIDYRFSEYGGDPDAIVITVAAMYEKPVFKRGLLDTLVALRDFLGKKELDEFSTIENPGCETCDWGSRYGYEFVAWTPAA